MTSPRRLLLKSRRLLETGTDAVRSRVRPYEGTTLDSVARRLEIVLAATYGRSIPIAPIVDPRPASAAGRAAAAVRRRLEGVRDPTAESDGTLVRLPPILPAELGPSEALGVYRLLALEQAERHARGTYDGVAGLRPLARDLYLLREADAVDGALARANAGLAGAIARERAAALSRRPPLPPDASALDRKVEELVCTTLARPLVEAGRDGGAPAHSREWAVREADAMEREASAGHSDDANGATYRGVAPVGLWGRYVPRLLSPEFDLADADLAPRAVKNAIETPLGDAAKASEKASKRPPKLSVSDEPQPGVAPPENMPLSGNDNVNHALVDTAPAGDGDPLDDVRGFAYPEWDYASGRYLPKGTLVLAGVADEGDEEWARAALASRGALVRRVQQQFERLRARRARLHAQDRGDDLDLVACVDAIVEKRAGRSPSERLYTMTRPARRGLAISLLVDTSGSTDTQVTHELQIIDIEKIAVLLATAAFDALGDAYNVLTFTGRGASEVRVTTIKGFGERSGGTTRRRIAGLHPDSGTRLGAAVRHATAELLRQPAGHRLLLILSDGRPNDVGYMDTYAVEDSRQAILEARGSGVFPFCLTVDRDGAEYLPHVFGSTGHVIIRDPEGLPAALLRAVRQLLRFA